MNTMDEYIAESEVFRVLNYDIEVKDELISEALKQIYKKRPDRLMPIGRYSYLLFCFLHKLRVRIVHSLRYILLYFQ